MPRKDRLPHIVIPADRTDRRDYTYPREVRLPAPTLPPKAPGTHGAKLLADLARVRAAAPTVDAARAAAGVPTEQGMLLEFEIEPGLDLALDRLDRKRDGIELISARERAGITLAAVLVPEGKLGAFEALIEQYRTEVDRRSGKPKNLVLGASIRQIRQAALETLWTDEGAPPSGATAIWWEVWLRAAPGAIDEFRRLARSLGMDLGDRHVEFLDRIVLLAAGTADQLASSVELLDCIAELRRAKDLASFFTGLSPREQGEWVDALAATVDHPGEGAPAVCLLDTGVNRGHPLLEPLLAPADMHAVVPAWGPTDHNGHGTAMAGLAAWGDLTTALAGTPDSPAYILESVVLLNPGWTKATPPKEYGAYTASAVALPEIAAPDRERVFCMTVTTTDFRDRGKPSSWSSEVDTLSHGGRDERPRLIVISVGNVEQAQWRNYIDENDTEQVHDPGQAWNALTVGAYTDKAWFDPQVYPGHSAIAPPGGLSPASTTSVQWASPWPNKPDVVMEGGNATRAPGGLVDLPDELRLLSTYWKPMNRLLDATGDTSGAAALASGLAAAIQARLREPFGGDEVWPETVRALVVHSARWTREMSDGTADKRVRLRRFGWGVPDLGRATWSATNALTLLAQRSIQPFANENPPGRAPSVKSKDWHLYDLPWPTDALLALGETTVELRVTLSYFIEPNPARRGWRTKHRYQSAGLRFAVKNPRESVAAFRARVSKNEQDEDVGLPSEAERGWLLGVQRNRGSIQSDVWTGTAAELAERGHLAVHPVGGWWRERVGQGKYDNKMRYALVVSIHTPEVGVDVYTPVAVEVGVAVEIE